MAQNTGHPAWSYPFAVELPWEACVGIIIQHFWAILFTLVDRESMWNIVNSCAVYGVKGKVTKTCFIIIMIMIIIIKQHGNVRMQTASHVGRTA